MSARRIDCAHVRTGGHTGPPLRWEPRPRRAVHPKRSRPSLRNEKKLRILLAYELRKWRATGLIWLLVRFAELRSQCVYSIKKCNSYLQKMDRTLSTIQHIIQRSRAYFPLQNAIWSGARPAPDAPSSPRRAGGAGSELPRRKKGRCAHRPFKVNAVYLLWKQKLSYIQVCI